MFRVKICGITRVKDALATADSGADAIGLNFYAGSQRAVDVATATQIISAVGTRLSVVGVFVNSPLTMMVQLADQLSLDFIQLHGDEPLELLRDLAPRQVIRALRLREGEDELAVRSIVESQALCTPPAALLIDAYQDGSFGGTGKQANWGQIRNLRPKIGPCPIVLAGGLSPSNVVEAISQAECDAVDVASGVESSPGRKDIVKLRRFVANALSALGK